MESSIEKLCDELSQKLNKKITYKSDFDAPNFQGGVNYRLFYDDIKTQTIINSEIEVWNKEAFNELIDFVCYEFELFFKNNVNESTNKS